MRGVIERRGVNIVQTLHATLLLLLPTLATIIAIALGVAHGVKVWELAILGVMYVATMIGITLGLHRMLAHRCFQASRALRVVLAILGSMAAQGPPVYWASNHRRHHTYSDVAGDLHSPHRDGDLELTGLRGFWHAHVGWTFNHALTNTAIFSKDLLRDRDLTIVNRHYYLWVLLGLVLPGVAGWLIERNGEGFLDGVLWGGGVRLFLSYHFISSINSVVHVSGYRRFNTHESSRNNYWLALPTLGESWHNNHHANPRAANFGCTWWEFDFGWLLIRLFSRLGWVRNMNHRVVSLEEKEVLRPTTRRLRSGLKERKL